jgi:hypothetical protein
VRSQEDQRRARILLQALDLRACARNDPGSAIPPMRRPRAVSAAARRLNRSSSM